MRSVRYSLLAVVLCAFVAVPALLRAQEGSKPTPKQEAPKKADDKKDADKKDAESKEPPAQPKIGDAVNDFELTGADGKKYKLSDYKDKILVLQWCNKDCPFCIKATPLMKETCEKFTPKGVAWLAIDSTYGRTAEVVNEDIKARKLPYPVLLDSDGKVGHYFGAKTTPHIFIVNKGKLAYRGASDDQKGRNYVAEALEALLAGKPVPSPETKSYGCQVKYKQ